MATPRQKRWSLEAFRRRIASADALPQMAILGTIAGTLTGVIILLFRALIHLPLEFLLPGNRSENFEALAPWMHFALPTAGAVGLGYLASRIRADALPVGLVHVLERLRRHQGHLPWRNACVQFVAGSIALLTGQSGGREGPAIHLGAATSSIIGQLLSLPNNSIRTLVGCGTAAAIAGSFNTPLAGVIFAMEVVLLDYSIASFIPVILAAVSATLLARAAFGDHTAFDVPDDIRLHGLHEIPFMVLEGLVIGVLAGTFIWLCRRVSRIEIGTTWLRFSIAGVFTGSVALATPQVLGVGYDTVEMALDGKLAASMLFSVAIAKVATSAVTCGLRMPVGLIGPSLVIGATAGGAMGELLKALLPTYAADSALYVMLGMAAMMGATLHAPLAALLTVVELTGNPNATLPAMLTIIVATITARSLYQQKGIFFELLDAQGMNLERHVVLPHLDRVGAASVMERNISCLRTHVTVTEATHALKDDPVWIVVEGPHGPYFLLNPADLENHLFELQTANDSNPDDNATIDLKEIPAVRLDVTSIDQQATLHEAWVRLETTNAEAICLRRVVAPMVAPTLGVLTKETCDRFVRSGV